MERRPSRSRNRAARVSADPTGVAAAGAGIETFIPVPYHAGAATGMRSRFAGEGPSRREMTSLLRFLLTILVLAGLGYGVLVALALFVEPVPLPCGGAPGDPGNRTLLDWNGDARVDASDAILTLDHLFRGGPAHVLGTGCVEVQGCPALCGG